MIDLDDIYDFLADKSQQTAQRIVENIVGRARQLETFPESGARQEFLSNQHKQYLYLIEGNYKVIYRIEEQVIYIIQIFDSRQDPNKMKD